MTQLFLFAEDLDLAELTLQHRFEEWAQLAELEAEILLRVGAREQGFMTEDDEPDVEMYQEWLDERMAGRPGLRKFIYAIPFVEYRNDTAYVYARTREEADEAVEAGNIDDWGDCDYQHGERNGSPEFVQEDGWAK